MISLLLGNWRFVLDALLIIGLVVLLFLLNPFGIFGDGLQLGTTTNMVTDMRKIGQLVTAEYYGEVISSLDESRLVLIEENETQQQANELYSEIKYALFDLYQYQQIPKKERREDFLASHNRSDGLRRKALQNVSRNNILEKLEFLSLSDSLINDPLYQQTIEFLWREKYQHSEKKNWNPNTRTEAEVLVNLYHELANQQPSADNHLFQQYLDDGFEFSANFQDFVFSDQKSELPRSERKKQLALVGRGWVKAGFNFDQLDENSFYLHEETGDLHFFGLEPQILDADINPWFIPERAVPGFEIIDHQGPVDFKDAQRVKEHCIQKLVFYAHQANIIEQAQTQGAETLKSFFSLVTGQPIQRVYFHNDLLTQTVKEIASDEYINYYEGLLLDTLLAQEKRRADSLATTLTNRTRNEQLASELDSIRRQSLRRLRKLPFEGLEPNFNFFSTLAYLIASDSIVDQHEQALLQQLRWNMFSSNQSNHQKFNQYKDPTYWYDDSLSFMMEYNATLAHLEKMKVQVADTVVENLTNGDELLNDWSDTTKVVLDYWHSTDSTTTVNYLDMSSQDTTLLTHLRFPFNYDREVIRSYVDQDSFLVSRSVKHLEDIEIKGTDYNGFHLYDQQKDTIFSIAMPPTLFFDRLLLGNTFLPQDSPQIFILTTEGSITTKNTVPLPLSVTQTKELIAYFRMIQSMHQSEQSKGAIIRASEWVRAKLTPNANSDAPLDHLNKFMREASAIID